MSATSSSISVLLVGATGALGSALADGLLHPRFRGQLALSVLVRQSQPSDAASRQQRIDALRAAGATIVFGDVEASHDELVRTLTGVDVVLCALNVQHIEAGELPLIAAAKAAGVGWFIPSEFGFDVEAVAAAGPLEQNPLPFFILKRKAREAIRAAGMDYTYVLTGGFMDWVLTTDSPSVVGYHPVPRTINVPGSLDSRISTIALPDIAAALGDAIVTGRGRNTTLRLGASTLSYRELVALVERVSGRKWTVVVKSQTDYAAAIAKDANDYYARFGSFVAAQHGCHWPVDATYNYKHGLPVQKVEQYAEQVVPRED